MLDKVASRDIVVKQRQSIMEYRRELLRVFKRKKEEELRRLVGENLQRSVCGVMTPGTADLSYSLADIGAANSHF